MNWKKGCGKWLGWVLLVLTLLLVSFYLLMRGENRNLDQEARFEVSGEFIQLSHGLVNFHLGGPEDAPLVVFVPGFSVPAYVWEPTLETLKEAGYQVLSYDLYGRGYSDRPDVVYDLDLFTSQLTELLSALEQSDPITLVGLSMGGPIVSRFAVLHPEQVSGVILIAPEVLQTTNRDIFPLNLPGVGEYLMAAVMGPIVLPKLQPADFYNPDNYPAWEELYKVQMQFRGTGRALLSTIRELVTLDPEAGYKLLKETNLPVLLIWGLEDQTIGLDQITILQEILPDLETLYVDQAGHLPHYEKPEVIQPVLLDFLSKYAVQD